MYAVYDFSVCDIGMGFNCNKVSNVPYIHVFYVCRSLMIGSIKTLAMKPMVATLL